MNTRGESVKAKLGLFVIMMAIALVFIVIGVESKTIVCDNLSKTCTVTKKNPILKTENITSSINVAEKTGFSVSVLGVGYKDYSHFACRSAKSSSHSSNKKYYLVPYGRSINTQSSIRNSALNEYSTKVKCEMDKEIINSYLDSSKTEPYTKSYPFNSLPFIIGSLLALFALFILFNPQCEVTIGEMPEEGKLTEEQKKAIAEKAMKAKQFIDGFANFDKDFSLDSKDIIRGIRKFKK